ncbi:hypothetical protein Tco_1404405 [Tanacetum coccineum]
MSIQCMSKGGDAQVYTDSPWDIPYVSCLNHARPRVSHLPRKASQLQKQMDAKSAWFQEKYSGRTPKDIGCSSSETNCPLTEKELHQLHDGKSSKIDVEEEAMTKKAREKEISKTSRK